MNFCLKKCRINLKILTKIFLWWLIQTHFFTLIKPNDIGEIMKFRKIEIPRCEIFQIVDNWNNVLKKSKLGLNIL